MTSHSLIMSLPYIQQNQAQKHVTHNEALRSLDVLVHLAVDALPQSAPPAAPVQGMRFIVGAGAISDWAGQDGKIALFDGSWLFFDPVEGWRAEVPSAATSYVFRSGTWVDAGAVNYDNLDGIGIMATHDATNRLSVSADATLLNHAGAGHQLKLNKSSVGDTASLLFQTNWGGRAEIGTAGTDDLEVKVSSDGATWQTGLSVASATGHVTVPRLSSGILSVPNDGVGVLPTPGVGGFVLLTIVHDTYPQVPHSGIFAYDTGASRYLEPMALGSKIVSGGTVVLTGTSGPAGKTSVAAGTGEILIENRFGSPRDYSFTFLGGT